MGAFLADVLAQFGHDLSVLPGVVLAHCTVETRCPQKVHLWTLLAHRDELTERQLAAAERRVLETFPDFGFDFTTTHLLGRDPDQFIPEGAVPVPIRRSTSVT